MTPRRLRHVCLFLAVAALGLRVPGLAEKPVNIDEIGTRRICRQFRLRNLEGRPPVSFVLVAGSLKLRDSQVNLLMPSAIMGAATVGLLAWTARVALGWRVGLLAGLWLLFSPLHISYSQFARYYSFMIFFSLLSYLYLELWLRLRRHRYLLAWFVVSALNLLTHFFAAFVVAVQGAIVLVALAARTRGALRQRGRRTEILVAVLAVAAVALGAWLAYVFGGLSQLVEQQLARKRDWQTPGIDISWAFWRPYLAAMTGWPRPVMAAAYGLAVVGAAVCWRRNKAFLVHALALLAVPVVVVDLVQPEHFFHIQYVAFALPFYVTVLVAAIGALWQEASLRLSRAGAWLRWARAPLALLIVSSSLLAFPAFANEPVRRSFRDIVRLVERLVRPGDLVIFTNPEDSAEFRYFLSGRRDLRTTVVRRWTYIRDFYYRRRFERPFWVVTGRLHRHDRREIEWLINNLTHKAFDEGFVFYSAEHIDMNLSTGFLTKLKRPAESYREFSSLAGMEAYRFSVYIPRSWDYYLLANQDLRGSLLSVESVCPRKIVEIWSRPVTERSRVWLAESRHDFTLLVPRGLLSRVHNLRLRIIPACATSYTINATHFDLIKGRSTYDYPVTYQGRFGMEMRLWGLLSYPVVVEREGRYRFSITADNDRPTTNQIALWINKTPVRRFRFGRCDNSIETKSAVIRLRRGFQVLTLRNEYYRGVDEVRIGPVADLRKTTFIADFSLEYLEQTEDRPP